MGTLALAADEYDVWTDGAREEAIPRHAEVNEKLARKILRRAGDQH